MRRLFLVLSGVDRDLLAKCRQLAESERQRFAAYGGLLLIPATLGFVAMAYTVFTFVPDVRAAVVAGVVWAVIVLWIDRFLAMTMNKSFFVPPRIFWGLFVVRVALAGVIGYGLSHPTVLFLFRGAIGQEMAAESRSGQQAAFAQAGTARARVYGELEAAKLAATKDLVAELDRKTKRLECTSTLISLEQAKGVSPGTPAVDRDGNVCGVASGEEGCKERCQSYVKERDQLVADIAGLRGDIRSRVSAVEAGMGGETAIAARYADRLQEEITKEVPPTDYAARTRALAALEARSPEVRAVRWFVVAFLMLLDTLVITLKAFTPRGEYEEVRDSALAHVQGVGRAERSAIEAWTGTHYEAVMRSRLAHEAHKAEMTGLLQAVNDALQEQAVQFRHFESMIRSLYENVRSVKSDEDRRVFAARLSDIRQGYADAWAKAIDRFRAYIRSL